MNLQNIFNEIEKTDPEIYERLDSRRNIMHRFKSFGGKLALTAIPVALGSMLNKAYGQTPSNIVDILNFALTLEYLESDFYTTTIVSLGSKIDPSETSSFALIKQQEDEHVAFLTTTIASLGGIPATKPEFDFTKGNSVNPFENYLQFLALAQIFEDTGVRAYKGQVTGLISNNEILTAALQIHSVEGRHAAHVRNIRRLRGDDPKEKPWITGKSTNGIGSDAQPTYDGEENSTQLGIDLITLSNISSSSATESFDEPLTMDQVNAIIDPYIL